jgi:hypothetical protein
MLIHRLLPLSIIAVVVACTFSSCAVVMATRQPEKKDLALLNVGTPRSLVVAEFGAPIQSETKNGRRAEIFSFAQGYSKSARVSRAFAHGAADVLTAGLWEVVGTPTELAFDGRPMVALVTFDAGERVETVAMLKK